MTVVIYSLYRELQNENDYIHKPNLQHSLLLATLRPRINHSSLLLVKITVSPPSYEYLNCIYRFPEIANVVSIPLKSIVLCTLYTLRESYYLRSFCYCIINIRLGGGTKSCELLFRTLRDA